MNDASSAQPSIIEVLRSRILRGLQSRTLGPGDRLPSARELVAEFDVDHRLILGAYRQLATEGLVEVRERGGVYVADANAQNAPGIPTSWFVETLSDALAREIPALDIAEWLRRATDTVKLRAVVISSTEDQVAGLARELRDDFGLVAEGLVAASIDEANTHATILKRANVIVSTAAHSALAASLAEKYALPTLTIAVRPDLVAGEWAMLLRQPVWAIVATDDFGKMLRAFFANVRGVENLTILVHGRDDLSAIPIGAPTYVTQRVRQSLDMSAIRGRILPPARTIAAESARTIFDFVVRANIKAYRAIRD